MREIVLDTETTGLDPLNGDRIIEIGCVELRNYVPTGRTFQRYVNPERDVHPDATAISGLTWEKLKHYSVFGGVAGELLDFIEAAPLVIHNAKFDIGFLNAELGRLGLPSIALDRATDTVQLARRMFPGAPASLDALCKRFGVDNSSRTFHGALLDCQLLAECYLELRGGRQTSLMGETMTAAQSATVVAERAFRAARPHAPTPEEAEAHENLLAQIKNAMWKDDKEKEKKSA
ncbi:MAG: DNA polymerase III subunit epsilon [Pseudomonadota bacterium]|nr:DNA polymerase III subunit epsilon [Pseudomonadota bacterium]